jgi:hypothetical protein
VAGLSLAHPGVEVALPGCLERQSAGGEPVQQGDGSPDVSLGGHELAVRRVFPGQAAAEPTDDLPDRIPVQQLALLRAGPAGDGPRHPRLQAGQLLVAGRQCPGGDEDRAQVPQRFAVGKLVEGRVGQRPSAAGEVAENGGVLVVVQPAQHGCRAAGSGQAVAECSQFGADAPPELPARSSSSLPPSAHRGQGRPGRILASAPQPGQMFQDEESGDVQARQSGWSKLPL